MNRKVNQHMTIYISRQSRYEYVTDTHLYRIQQATCFARPRLACSTVAAGGAVDELRLELNALVRVARVLTRDFAGSILLLAGGRKVQRGANNLALYWKR